MRTGITLCRRGGLPIALAIVIWSCGNASRSVGDDNSGGAFASPDAKPCETTLEGTLYNPGGTTPVYNAYVSIPTTPIDPISPGLAPTCTPCPIPVSGSPSTFATTDPTGHFVLHDVPTQGDTARDVPLVMQVGKWRRQIVVPEIRRCQANVIEDRNLTRLPRNKSEGDMPRIAVTSGVDNVACTVLSRIGIDPAEFTSPDGDGRVHTYQGEATAFHGPYENGWGDASDLWSNLETMKKYDVIIESCQGAIMPRSGTAPGEHMKAYLDAGGRFFTSHWDAIWLIPPDSPFCVGACLGPPEFADAVDWSGGKADELSTTHYINTTVPKGAALDDWMQTSVPLLGGVLPARGTVGIHNTLAPESVTIGRVRGTTTSWVFRGSLGPRGATTTELFAFNTPWNRPPEQQCGRVVHYSGHVYQQDTAKPPSANDGDHRERNYVFPHVCLENQDYLQSQLLFEFMFFDIGTCVGDDRLSPIQPH